MRGIREGLDVVCEGVAGVPPVEELTIPNGYSATFHDATPGAVPQPAPQKPAPRLTVITRVVYERPGHSPEGVRSGYDTPLESGEQMYQRDTKAPAGEWAPLDTGWLKDDVNMVVVENKGEAAVWVGFGTGRPGPDTIPGLIVYPGKSHALTPFRSSRIFLRASGPDPVPVTITAIPS